jgi:hypothetical protein
MALPAALRAGNDSVAAHEMLMPNVSCRCVVSAVICLLSRIAAILIKELQ